MCLFSAADIRFGGQGSAGRGPIFIHTLSKKPRQAMTDASRVPACVSCPLGSQFGPKLGITCISVPAWPLF